MRLFPQRQRIAGHGGASYDSESEARASHVLATHGIVRDTSGFLPVWFHDADGQPFRAKADFIHPPTGVRFEFKNSFLNPVKTQATATSQYASSRCSSESMRYLKFSWSNAAPKLALVQDGMARAGGALVALLWREPDAATIKGLNKRGTFWVVYGSPAWRSLLGFLTLRAHGLAATLTFSDDHGQPVHTFR